LFQSETMNVTLALTASVAVVWKTWLWIEISTWMFARGVKKVWKPPFLSLFSAKSTNLSMFSFKTDLPGILNFSTETRHNKVMQFGDERAQSRETTSWCEDGSDESWRQRAHHLPSAIATNLIGLQISGAMEIKQIVIRHRYQKR
jgi:hypothetical protein